MPHVQTYFQDTSLIFDFLPTLYILRNQSPCPHRGPAARANIRRHQMRPVAPGSPFRNGALGRLVPVAVKCLKHREPKKDLVMSESLVFQWFSVAAFPEGCCCWLMLIGSFWERSDSYFKSLCCSIHQYGRSCQSHRTFCNWAGASVLSLRCFIGFPAGIWHST